MRGLPNGQFTVIQVISDEGTKFIEEVLIRYGKSLSRMELWYDSCLHIIEKTLQRGWTFRE